MSRRKEEKNPASNARDMNQDNGNREKVEVQSQINQRIDVAPDGGTMLLI